MTTKILHLDWLAFTLNNSYGVDSIEKVLRNWSKSWDTKFIPTQAKNGYKSAWMNKSGVSISSGHERMGIHVVIPGQSLTDAALPADYLIGQVYELTERITRLDIAIDLLDTSLTVKAVHTAIRREFLKKGRKKVTEIQSENGGHTLYIGSRSSSYMLRIYNKQAEALAVRGMETQSWVRFEVELKSEAARFAVQAIVQNGFDNVAVALLQKGLAVGNEDKLHKDILLAYKAGESVEVQISQRATSNTRKWLLSTAVNALAKESEKDEGIIDEFFQLLLRLRGFNEHEV